jgi:zinc resistance-associated protein
MKKLVTILGILLLTAVIAYPVFAHGPGWGGWGHMWGSSGGPGYCWRGDGGARGLSQDQRDNLDALDRKFFNETETLRNEIWNKNVELDKLLNAQNPDEGKIKSLQKEISTLRNQMAEKRLNYRLEARKVAPEGYNGGNAGRYSERSSRGGRGRGGCWN